MKWLSKLLRRRDPDDWRMVKQLDSIYINTETRLVSETRVEPVETKHHINYYLFENQYGGRKFDVACSMMGDRDVSKLSKDDIAYRLRIYRNTIKPWLDGQYNPEIPSYESIKPKEFLDNLAGKIT